MDETTDGVIRLFTAARRGNITQLQDLVKSGISIDSQDKNGETALHVTVWNNNIDVTAEIVQLGADINIQNQNGQTPLHIAATHGYNDVIKQLLEADNCDMDICTNYSEMTALHLACLNSHTQTVRLLLQHGADTNILDVIDKPAEFYASNTDIHDVFTEDYQRRLFKRYVTELDFDLDKSMQEMDLHRSEKKIKHKKMKYSRAHKKKMKLNVFDRLTRRKSQFLKD